MKPAALTWPLPPCLLLLLTGFSGAVNISVPSEPIQAVAGGSVLLPVTYSIPDPLLTLQVTWNHETSIVLYAEMAMCGSGATLRICNKLFIVVGRYQHRVVFYPENASLLLMDVHQNDSGQYTVAFEEMNHSRSLMLVIHDRKASFGDPDSAEHSPDEEEQEERRRVAQSLLIRGSCAAIFVLLVAALHCTWWRQTRRYRIESL
ncbi:HEPACAM family member 2-like [Engystomops pustulosus]|uniref:HEPACAM family member 2-like n=1 Tax=Engystomops pustulosus TaxID=76066 RepID=UPI003AFAF44F